MRTILVIAFVILSGLVNAQSKLKPLTDEEIMYSDKLNGTLVSWSNDEKKAFLKDCKSKIGELIENGKSFCNCAMKSMMTGVNYKKYDEASDYQKGRLTSMHGTANCKPIIKKEE